MTEFELNKRIEELLSRSILYEIERTNLLEKMLLEDNQDPQIKDLKKQIYRTLAELLSI